MFIALKYLIPLHLINDTKYLMIAQFDLILHIFTRSFQKTIKQPLILSNIQMHLPMLPMNNKFICF